MRIFVLIGLFGLFLIAAPHSHRCISCMDHRLLDSSFFAKMTAKQMLAWKHRRILPQCQNTAAVTLVNCNSSCVKINMAQHTNGNHWAVIGKYYDCQTSDLAQFLTSKKESDPYLYILQEFSDGNQISDLTGNFLDNFYNSYLVGIAIVFAFVIAILTYYFIESLGNIFGFRVFGFINNPIESNDN
ncbi:unnamed protein product [Caenorhabditis bovis]|uniref:Uncharacterized protein n=1 Tax=Caenorhabditis bovis TaxID=2654633 RepID=A0A8S1FCK8_9PELO|nr:unnamed protein product [Caenorhabditis bovis]